MSKQEAIRRLKVLALAIEGAKCENSDEMVAFIYEDIIDEIKDLKG